MDKTIDLQLVKHSFTGSMPLFELQIYSQSKCKWYMLHTGSRLQDIENFCMQYSYSMPDKIIICKHEQKG